MARHPILQPDGRWAVYSTVVDQFVDIGCDDAQAAWTLSRRTDEDAGMALIRALRSGERAPEMCWEQALRQIADLHGERDERGDLTRRGRMAGAAWAGAFDAAVAAGDRDRARALASQNLAGVLKAFGQSVPHLTLIAGVARNGVIGANGGLPWSLPEDLRHFKATTAGHPVIMGRATFDSLGRPLPGRLNIVMTRGHEPLPAGVVAVDSLEEAVWRGGREAGAKRLDDVFVIGGARVYAAALPWATCMILSEIDLEPEGDTLFPAWDRADWMGVGVEEKGGDPSWRVATYGRV